MVPGLTDRNLEVGFLIFTVFNCIISLATHDIDVGMILDYVNQRLLSKTDLRVVKQGIPLLKLEQ